MASQLVALGIQPPRFDVPGAAANAQRLVRGQQDIRRADMANQLASMKLGQEGKKAAALDAFRAARAAGDPNAMQKLRAYPEIAATMHKALDSMRPNQVRKAKETARVFGDAARYINSFAPGSPERAAAWDAKTDELAAAGHIDKAQADHWKKVGPSDLILEQALLTEDIVGRYQGAPKLAREQKEKIEDLVSDFRDAITPDDIVLGGDKLDEIETRVDAERRRLEEEFAGKRRSKGDNEAVRKSQDRVNEDGAPPVYYGDDPLNPRRVSEDNANQVDLGAGTGKIYVNPKTGERIKFDGKAWVPVE